MHTTIIEHGSHQVIVSGNDEEGPFTSRLYVNNGETATLQIKKAKTLKGAYRQAKELLGNPSKLDKIKVIIDEAMEDGDNEEG